MTAPALPTRLWVYQAERFPLARTAVLVAAFSAASVNASAFLAGRDLPGPGAYAVAFALVLALMFQLRVLDEIKDAETDRLHRPERPIPRGLVSLRELVSAGAISMVVAMAAALLWTPATSGALLAAWIFMGLMTVHFFAPGLLARSPLLVLASHMLVMPFVDLVATSAEWGVYGATPPGLWAFLALSYANGVVLEVGRKTWAPENERPGVETYSAAWGIPRALAVWGGAVVAATVLLCVYAALVQAWAVAPAAILVAAAAIVVGCRLAARRDGDAQRHLDAASGAWILASYAIAGFLPLL